MDFVAISKGEEAHRIFLSVYLFILPKEMHIPNPKAIFRKPLKCVFNHTSVFQDSLGLREIAALNFL